MSTENSRATHCANDLARCDLEIAEASEQTDKPAYLVALGVEDWECEKRLIQAGA